jgi:hypothetical protein
LPISESLRIPALVNVEFTAAVSAEQIRLMGAFHVPVAKRRSIAASRVFGYWLEANPGMEMQEGFHEV